MVNVVMIFIRYMCFFFYDIWKYSQCLWLPATTNLVECYFESFTSVIFVRVVTTIAYIDACSNGLGGCALCQFERKSSVDNTISWRVGTGDIKCTNILCRARCLVELSVLATVDLASEDGLGTVACSVVRYDDGDLAVAAHEAAAIGAVELGVVDGTSSRVDTLPKSVELKKVADGVRSAETTDAGILLLSGEGRRGGSESAKDSGSGKLHDCWWIRLVFGDAVRALMS